MSAPAAPAVIRKESQGHTVNGIAIGFVAASAVAVALRFYTRTVLLKITGKDDWTLLGGLVSKKTLLMVLPARKVLTETKAVRDRCLSCDYLR